MRRSPQRPPLLAAALRGAIAEQARRERVRQRMAVVEALECARVSPALLLAALDADDLAAILRLRARRERLAPTSSPREIAEYMLQSVREDGCLYRDVLLADLRQRSAGRYLLHHGHSGLAIDPVVLRAFRKLTVGTVRWDPSQQYWRSAERLLDDESARVWSRTQARPPLSLARIAG